MQKRAKTMQFQPKYPYSYLKIDLDHKFPFHISEPYLQMDKTITHLHFHNYPELGICLEGSGVFVVEGKILPFQGGDIIYIARNERHLAQSLQGTVSRWHWIYFDLEKLLYPALMDSGIADLSHLSGRQFKNLISSGEYPELCSSVRKILDVWQENSPFMKEKLHALLTLFAANMKEEFKNNLKNESVINPEPDLIHRLDKALETISRRYMEPLKITELAATCNMSPTHFRRLFNESFGKSPRDYLNQMRISMAMAELLRSNKPVAEIAFSCGFDTLSSFNRQFKSQNGLSPRIFRKRAPGHSCPDASL